MTELLRIFNKNGDVLKPLTLEQALVMPDIFYGVANVWILDEQNRLLCSLRSAYARLEPSSWQSFLGGKLQASETHLQAAVRELAEEIGLKILPENFVHLDKGFTTDSKRYFESYILAISNEDIKKISPNPGEIVEVRWLTMDEYNREVADYPDLWRGYLKPKYQKEILRWRSLSGKGQNYASNLLLNNIMPEGKSLKTKPFVNLDSIAIN